VTMIGEEKEKRFLKHFWKKKIMTISEIAESMQCSIPTVRNRLKKWKTYTSYNNNGRFYTLPDIPTFDQDGLWKFKGAFFSKQGNLTQTIIHLVKKSESGLTASEIAKRLGLSNPLRSLITYLKTIPGLHREKPGEYGSYVYFSAEKSIYSSQKQRRESQIKEKDIHGQLPSESDSIAVLVDIIKHPRTTIKKCAGRLKKNGIMIKPESIRNLLQYHGIVIEKKTLDILC
jgi:DNA-binding CsgD family transcriptional regulator